MNERLIYEMAQDEATNFAAIAGICYHRACKQGVESIYELFELMSRPLEDIPKDLKRDLRKFAKHKIKKVRKFYTDREWGKIYE